MKTVPQFFSAGFFAAMVFAFSFALFFAPARGAVEPEEFSSAEQTERYRKIISELRCLVCQNQNLADSNADLARDMRGAAADLIRQGKTDGEIAEFMTARYGDFVLYRPPFKPLTWALWLGPAALLVVGMLAAAAALRRPRRAALSEEEKRRAAEILDGE